jgi:Fe2+ or Zn2+ uptake regulation protein
MVYTGYAKTALGLGTSYNSYCVLDLHHHHLFVCVCGGGTQELHLEPLHLPFL